MTAHWDSPPTRFVESGGAQLAVSVCGDRGTPLVALHPGVADRRIWRWCAPSWAGAGYQVVAYDRRGFGETRYAAEPHDELADLRAVTDATGSRPAVVVGNSMGGGLALDLALEHPDDVLALVLIASAPSGYPDDDWPETEAEAAQDRLMQQAEESGDRELLNRLEVRYWLDGTEQPEGRVTGPPRDLMADMNGQALAAPPGGESVRRRPAWPRLEQVAVPTLVIAGEHDLPGEALAARRTAERIPDARLTILDGTAHCPALDRPAQLAEVVLGFLASVRP